MHKGFYCLVLKSITFTNWLAKNKYVIRKFTYTYVHEVTVAIMLYFHNWIDKLNWIELKSWLNWYSFLCEVTTTFCLLGESICLHSESKFVDLYFYVLCAAFLYLTKPCISFQHLMVGNCKWKLWIGNRISKQLKLSNDYQNVLMVSMLYLIWSLKIVSVY